MRKIYLLLLVLTGLSSSLLAQNGKHCFTDEIYMELIRNHPEILEADRQREQETQARTQLMQNSRLSQSPRTASVIYVIPVVFHIIHEYGAENITDAQIHSAIDVLNRDYNLMNPDTVDALPEFKPLIANIGIEFRLATLDPSGNCTNGIDRIFSFRTEIGDDAAKLNPWPSNKYLNIWTVKTFGSSHSTAAAYAYRPGNAPSSSVDGIISLSNYVGNMGTSNANNSRTLTHEIGHFFNLNHPWTMTPSAPVATTCGDDGVSDTPVTKGWDVCPASNFDVCNAGINENFQNYMDYSYCDVMFTVGQKTRMILALNTNTAGRNHLWVQGNLDSTGTNGTIGLPCAPVADFYPAAEHYCMNDSVQYFSNTFNTDTITSYSWTFPSGTPSSSTLRNPRVAYTTPGIHEATLRVENGQGADSLTKDTAVVVFDVPSMTPNYFNDFETAGDFLGPDGYIINNVGNAWQRTTTAGFSGTSSLKFLNYNQGQLGLTDSWVSPSLDLTGYTGTTLTFRLAYARKDVTRTDVLNIYTSTNCGRTWTFKRGLSGATLATVPNVTVGYTPASTADWALISVTPMSAVNNKSNVRLRFEFISGGDNNIYIDDINLSANPTGIVEAEMEAMNFDVFPNPSNDIVSISFEMQSSAKAQVKITDMLGREVKTVVDKNLSSGAHEFQVNTNEFGQGIYLVSLKAGELSSVKKLIVE